MVWLFLQGHAWGLLYPPLDLLLLFVVWRSGSITEIPFSYYLIYEFSDSELLWRLVVVVYLMFLLQLMPHES